MQLTDAGLETVILFEEGIDLPHFAAFPLVDSDEGQAALRRYYGPFLELARDRGVPLVLSTPTWRASSDWGRLLGYEPGELAAANRRAVARAFMINCAHPTHFADSLPEGDARGRIRGLRANASMRSHAELDEAEELDSGDPDDLADRYVALRHELPELEVLGGCCGTNIRHVTAICDAWLAPDHSG